MDVGSQSCVFSTELAVFHPTSMLDVAGKSRTRPATLPCADKRRSLETLSFSLVCLRHYHRFDGYSQARCQSRRRPWPCCCRRRRRYKTCSQPLRRRKLPFCAAEPVCPLPCSFHVQRTKLAGDCRILFSLVSETFLLHLTHCELLRHLSCRRPSGLSLRCTRWRYNC